MRQEGHWWPALKAVSVTILDAQKHNIYLVAAAGHTGRVHAGPNWWPL